MKKLLASLAIGVTTFALGATEITGTGASFPYPVYKEWIKGYYKETGNRVNYTPTGSGTGIKEVAKRHVDFGGTDKPLPPKLLDKGKLYQFPTVIGGIVLAYNIPGADKLKLSESAIKGIVLGKIAYWDNPTITKDNPDLNLPHKKIIFVHRSDKSGTTFNFTYYLSKMSPEWNRLYGARKMINWPTDAQGRGIAGKGNFGVSAAIKTNPYSIGYVDYADAKKNGLKMAIIQGADGKFVAPTPENFAKGAENAGFDPKKDFYKIIAYPKTGYPIIAATFILLPQEKVETNKAVVKFFQYGFNHDEVAQQLGYIPLPQSVKKQVEQYWTEKGLK
ncbi:MAG: phosphate ABC transporter substrate-binding protein PstS [Epsilonproteobacteria bacterium]|jgi:phosphate transport system substrate-binding protein|nr:phosphate ABC transporter substrate-binding protein PstS [Campylobacterota bacterium]NPA89321.1 phosphate ABC transporter substrate-binding protein PstS [Campylobacterota bacterium]